VEKNVNDIFKKFLKNFKGKNKKTQNITFRGQKTSLLPINPLSNVQVTEMELTMTIREKLEQDEREYLSPYATLSMNSKGRLRPEAQCDIRPVFQRDRDRIIHSKAFRRLKDKTQVFLTPEGDHYRTRLTHTLEVSQNARTIAKALRLNEDLVEAISLGHDLGHTPFGHAGERALDTVCPYGFMHNEQSVRTVDLYEKEGHGLNLTIEVRDGILNHQTESMPSTLEGKMFDFRIKSLICITIWMTPFGEGFLRKQIFPGKLRMFWEIRQVKDWIVSFMTL